MGILQGLTEFLPVSSSAHLILFPRYFGWQSPGLYFDVALHLGTLTAVLLYFWKDLWSLSQGLLAPKNPELAPHRRTVGFIVLATIPGVIAGLLLEEAADNAFRSPILIAGALLVAGTLLGLADRFCTGKRTLEGLTWKSALGIGVAQSLALIPGVSRSGSTITAGLALGMTRTEAARFSFLLSVPIIAGAGILKLPEILEAPSPSVVAIGFVAAAVSGVLAIKFLMSYVLTRTYRPFVIYRWGLALFVLFNLARFQ